MDADKFKPYRPGDPPVLEGSAQRYAEEEYRKISTSLASALSVLKLLESRIAALE